MQRRQFIAASLASSALSLGGGAFAQTPAEKEREFYQLRKYTLQTGPATDLTEKYFSQAMIPALKRLGMGPVGAFKLDIGPETPTFYLLIPSSNVKTLVTLDWALAADAEFMTAAAPFWSAPAVAPAFQRVECSLHAAFEGWPHIVPPPGAATKAKRIFQMRTYESPSFDDHVRKVEMFNTAEMGIFKDAGHHPVFFGDTLLGPRMPSLTYMLSFDDLDQLTAQWQAFSGSDAWKKLKSEPRYGSEAIVSNISNLILSPLSMSQI